MGGCDAFFTHFSMLQSPKQQTSTIDVHVNGIDFFTFVNLHAYVVRRFMVVSSLLLLLSSFPHVLLLKSSVDNATNGGRLSFHLFVYVGEL